MMEAGKRAAAHGCAVMRAILFIGFSVQIVLGGAWICRNFGEVQDFQESGSALYRELFGLLGRQPQVLYLLQLGAAFGVSYRFLCRGGRLVHGGWLFRTWERRLFAAWGSLVLLTFPFALQCHLAVLPCSFQSSLFLLGLSFLLELFAWPGYAARRKAEESVSGEKRDGANADGEGVGAWEKKESGRSGAGGRMAGRIGLAVICFCVMGVLYQGMEGSLASRYGWEAVLASRMGWPTLWQDQGGWPKELQEIVRDVAWQSSFNPENMEVLCQRIEEAADRDTAEGYYLQIAGYAWQMHSSMVIRQIGWDGLGYALTPVIVPLQLKGEAYDSFTGRNYEVMRENAPLLTKYYVDFSCWWFVCCLVIGICLMALKGAAELTCAEGREAVGKRWKRCLAAMFLCVFLSAVLAALLAMRGAGLMDYKSTTAVNELWLAGVLLFMGTG